MRSASFSAAAFLDPMSTLAALACRRLARARAAASATPHAKPRYLSNSMLSFLASACLMPASTLCRSSSPFTSIAITCFSTSASKTSCSVRASELDLLSKPSSTSGHSRASLSTSGGPQSSASESHVSGTRTLNASIAQASGLSSKTGCCLFCEGALGLSSSASATLRSRPSTAEAGASPHADLAWSSFARLAPGEKSSSSSL
mmetsp:Transcript_74365/g.177175  ORF Transcript_74365/g.177175 Transcript_74365/m.177175 type:complete len:203 (+) Transcript_74365:2205-2813(+)